MLNCHQMNLKGPCLKEFFMVRQTAWNEVGDPLTAWPSVQFCMPVRRHEVAGRWTDTWQKCAWERFPCRVVPPDHCKDQLEETQKTRTWYNDQFSLCKVKMKRVKTQISACSAAETHDSSRMTGQWPCLWDSVIHFDVADWTHRLIWTVWHSFKVYRDTWKQHYSKTWNM